MTATRPRHLDVHRRGSAERRRRAAPSRRARARADDRDRERHAGRLGRPRRRPRPPRPPPTDPTGAAGSDVILPIIVGARDRPDRAAGYLLSRRGRPRTARDRSRACRGSPPALVADRGDRASRRPPPSSPTPSTRPTRAACRSPSTSPAPRPPSPCRSSSCSSATSAPSARDTTSPGQLPPAALRVRACGPSGSSAGSGSSPRASPAARATPRSPRSSCGSTAGSAWRWPRAFIGPVWHFLDPFSTLHDIGAAVVRRLGVDAVGPRRLPGAARPVAGGHRLRGRRLARARARGGPAGPVRRARRLHGAHARDDGPVRARHLARERRGLHRLVPAARPPRAVRPRRRGRPRPAAPVPDAACSSRAGAWPTS